MNATEFAPSELISISPAAPPRRARVDALLAPLFETAADSASLLGSRHEVTVAGIESAIPKFMLLGQRGGEKPIRLALLAAPNQPSLDGVAALARLFLQFELNPGLAKDYALFGYPIVDAAELDLAEASAGQFEERLARKPADGDVDYLRAEFQKWDFDGIVTLRTDPVAKGIHAEVRSAVIGREVVAPALAAAARSASLPAESIRYASPDSGSWHSALGTLGAPSRGRKKSGPFEITLFAPGAASEEERIRALFLAAHEILRNYRALISHAQHL